MVIDFDLSLIPEDAEIEEALYSMFFFYGDAAVTGRPNVCSLFTIEKEWIDTEVTWNNADKDTKWENLDFDTKFYNADIDDTVSSPGGGDYATPCIAVVEYAESNTWEEYDITEVIKDVLENGKPFYGFLTKQFICPRGSNYTNNGRVYHSSDYNTVEKRPKLTVTYTSTGINTQFPDKAGQRIQFLRGATHMTVVVPWNNSYDLTFFNSKGEMLFFIKGCNNRRIDIPAGYLSNGLYIVNISNKTGVISKQINVIQ